ncbi:MAG: hydroxymethylglutaryl-CoA lyase, partial [Chthoniobacterales bacterium]
MESIKLIECPRDAWQGLPRFIPTERKVEYLRALTDAGFRHIDAVSFVSPKVIPQMADSEEVLSQLAATDGVEIIGIVVNEKGAERAIATGGVSTLGFPFSISETFLRRNQNQSLEENEATLRSIAMRARGAGLKVVAYISMAFGNPYGDAWSEAAVVAAAQKIAAFGVASVSLSDTIGAADSALIHRVVTTASREIAEGEIGGRRQST